MANELYDSPAEAGATEDEFIKFDPPIDRTYNAFMVGGNYERLPDTHKLNPGKLECQLRFRLDHDPNLGDDLMRMVGGQRVRWRAVINSDRFERLCRTFGFDKGSFRPKDWPDMPCRVRLSKRPGTRLIEQPDGTMEAEETLYIEVDQIFKAESGQVPHNAPVPTPEEEV